VPPELQVRVETFWATDMGWQRRSDLGPDVWEQPDGALYQARPGEEPCIQVLTPLTERDS
jgi:hypothetical protein